LHVEDVVIMIDEALFLKYSACQLPVIVFRFIEVFCLGCRAFPFVEVILLLFKSEKGLFKDFERGVWIS